MNRIPIYLCLVSALLLLGAGETTPGQEAKNPDVSNPFVGTWVLNLDKSSNPLPLKSDIIKIEAQDNGLKFTRQTWVTTDGRSIRREYSPKFDGKFYPIIGSRDNTVSLRRMKKNSLGVVKKDTIGNERSRVMVISEDGMTATVTRKGKNAQGQEVTFIFVYDKQEG